MAEELNNTDRFFKNSLENFEASPPANIWDEIEGDLETIDKKRTLVIVYKIAASIAILLSIGFGYLYMNRLDTTQEITQAEEKIDPDIQKNENIKTERDKNLKTTTNNVITQSVSTKNKELELKTEIKNNQNSIAANTEMVVNENKQGELIAILQSNDENNVFEDISPLVPIGTRLISWISEKIHLTDQYFTSQTEELLFAQHIEQENDHKKWSIGGSFSPLLSDRYLNGNATYEMNHYNHAINANEINTYNDKELLAYSGGINVNLKTNDRLSIQSGIYYSKTGQRINDIGVIRSNLDEKSYLNSAILNTSDGQLLTRQSEYYLVDLGRNIVENTSVNWTPMSPENFDAANSVTYDRRIQNSVQNYNKNATDIDELANSITDQLNPSNNVTKSFGFIEIPLILKYKLIDKKLGFNILGGLSTNILVNNKLFFVSDAGKKNTIPDETTLEKVNYSSIVGIGLEYPLLDNLSFNLEPSFKYYLNSNQDGYDYQSYPLYSFAFFSGISYSF